MGKDSRGSGTLKTVKDLFDLNGRVAVITGGAGHLGLAFAEALSEQGCNIVVVDVQEDATHARAKEIEERFNVETKAIVCDLGTLRDAGELVRTVEQQFSRLDILINNAAFTGASGLPGYAVPFADQSFEAWEAAMRVNISAVFQLSQAAAPLMAKHGTGSIINIASIYGAVGPQLDMYEGTDMGMPAAYAASKGGMIQFTRYLSTALAPKVRANSVSPGGIERGQPESFRKKYESKTPLRRMGQEEDFKGIVAYLASDASSYVTGQNLFVDGGWTAW
jgi:NAD(P)-dependent dehydrogenase (short-subunit alcohol dehydrogenase family)